MSGDTSASSATRASIAWGERVIGWVAGALAAVPVLVSPYPPMTEFPRHEAVVALLRFWGDPERAPPGLYALHLGHPRQLFDLLAFPLSYVVPVTLACKIVVAATMIAVPVAAVRLARHRGASAWVAPALVPVALGWLFSGGFVNELLGLAALLAFLPELDRLANAPTWRRVGVATAGTVVLYLAHELSMLVYVIAAFVFALVKEPLEKKTLVRVAPGLAGIVMGAAALSARGASATPPTMRTPVSAKLGALPELLVGYSDRASTWIVFGSCVFVLAMIALEGRRIRRATLPAGALGHDEAPPDGAGGRVARVQRRLHPYRFELLALVCFVLFLAMPGSLNGTAGVYQRFLAPAYALLAVGAGVSFEASRRSLLRVLAAVLPLASLLVVWPAYVDSSRNIEDLDKLLQQIPRKSSVASIDLADSIRRPYGLAPAPSRVLVTRGGRVLSTSSDPAPMLVTIAAPFRWDEVTARVTRDNLALRPSHDLTRFRYLVVHSGSTQNVHITAAALLPEAHFVDTAGEWALFESRLAVVPLDAPDAPLPAPPPLTLRARIRDVLAPHEGAPSEKPAAPPVAASAAPPPP